jgi:hypothetical protein
MGFGDLADPALRGDSTCRGVENEAQAGVAAGPGHEEDRGTVMLPARGPRQRSRGLVGIATISSLALSACSASPHDEVKSAAVSFAAAAAGGNMALHQWLDGNLPIDFAERAVADASEAAADRMKVLVVALIQARHDPAWPIARVVAVLTALGDADADLSRSDRRAVAASVRRLDELLPVAPRGR